MKYLLAIFCPPLAILFCGGKVFQAALNFFLCLLFWVPGVIHALVVVNSYEQNKRTDRVVAAINGAALAASAVGGDGKHYTTKEVPVPGFTEALRAKELARLKEVYTTRGWEEVGFRENGAFGSKLVIRRPYGSLTWKDMTFGERFQLAGQSAVFVGALIFGIHVWNTLSVHSSSTPFGQEEASGISQQPSSGRKIATKATTKEKDFTPAEADAPDATALASAFESNLPFGLERKTSQGDVEAKIASVLKLVSTKDNSKYGQIMKIYSGTFAGMPAKITLSYDNGVLDQVMLAIRPKKSGAASTISAFRKAMESRFGAPLRENESHDFGWLDTVFWNTPVGGVNLVGSISESKSELNLNYGQAWH